MLGIVQQLGSGASAGLEGFIYGKTAAMVAMDVKLIAVAAVVAVLVCTLLFKELRALCFDQAYATSLGLPVLVLDIGLMAMVVMVTVVGLQAVGLILIIALLIIPAAAARFWSDQMLAMMALAGGLGAVSACLGSAASALFVDLPSGAIIVLVAAGMFLLSMLFGRARGVVPRSLAQRRLLRRVGEQHLLRSVYELLETERDGVVANDFVAENAVVTSRSWSRARVQRLARAAARGGHIELGPEGISLTAQGVRDAERLVRNHRLWEMYLITHADIAPSHVDRDADMIEHVLGPAMIAKLEVLLEAELLQQQQQTARDAMPRSQDVFASPHPLKPGER